MDFRWLANAKPRLVETRFRRLVDTSSASAPWETIMSESNFAGRECEKTFEWRPAVQALAQHMILAVARSPDSPSDFQYDEKCFPLARSLADLVEHKSRNWFERMFLSSQAQGTTAQSLFVGNFSNNKETKLCWVRLSRDWSRSRIRFYKRCDNGSKYLISDAQRLEELAMLIGPTSVNSDSVSNLAYNVELSGDGPVVTLGGEIIDANELVAVNQSHMMKATIHVSVSGNEPKAVQRFLDEMKKFLKRGGAS